MTDYVMRPWSYSTVLRSTKTTYVNVNVNDDRGWLS